ncbi:ATP-dependent Clp protease proteolytic subunit [Brucepastera parasyntrophica]|uniref:ATP-dependent Clp protease proteolytic subunit n=1 Tax=Brucepastera parasyntrophica TaxID=2880008 RepID=UPI002109D034|nr:ATP-dependent Clp protease proteolytic subunit [Brucepastera parasyntrophica]ULQ59004.1 ATP-dependent Clp protease proteolytic subunit [Brucepastera parasyntrophica]
MHSLYTDVIFWNEDDDENEENGRNREPEDIVSRKFLDTRQILLSGEINKVLAERIVRQLLVMEADSSDPIKIFIDSPGGDADAGYAIFDMIRFINAPVYTIGMGLVASAGSIILLAAERERRFGLPNSHFLIHQPLSGIKGVATEIEIHALELEKMRTKINELISKETGQGLEKVSKDTDRDFWMNAAEAKDYGLISGMITTRGDLP